MMLRNSIGSLLVAGLALGVSACNGSSGGGGSGGGGGLVVQATDAPFTTSNVSAASIDVTKVEITTDATGAGGFVTLYDGAAMTLDLFSLRNGVTQTLAAVTLTAGNYQQLRLTVSAASLTTISPSATFTMSGGTLTVPSGELVVNISPAITITSGLSTQTLLLDFVMGNVFVPQGPPSSPNSFHIQPAGIRALNKSTLGEIRGTVQDAGSNPLAGANVSAALPTAPSSIVAATVAGPVTTTAGVSYNYDVFVPGNVSYDLSASYTNVATGATLTASTALPVFVAPNNVTTAPVMTAQ